MKQARAVDSVPRVLFAALSQENCQKNLCEVLTDYPPSTAKPVLLHSPFVT
jgi:hypothetical protein